MKKAIVGVVMAVDAVEGSFKLNQHKSDVDRTAVAAALARQPHAGARELAQTMQDTLQGAMHADDVMAGTSAAAKTGSLEGTM